MQVTERSPWRPWLLPVSVWFVVQCFVLGRLSQALATYEGGSGAQFHTHLQRLLAWRHIERALAFEADFWRLPVTLDGDFPPLLHVVTSLLVAAFGHSLEAATASGMVWVVLLAAALGRIAHDLAPAASRHEAGAAAATGVLLVASYQAFSLRYYFDIPMTALLWAGVAALIALWDRSGWRTWLVPGALFAAAALTKWTALAMGGLMGLGVLCLALRSSQEERGRRVRAVVLSGLTAGLLAGGYAGLVGVVKGISSLQVMADTFNEEAMEVTFLTVDRLRFYPTWIVRSVLSPALAIALLPLIGLWTLRSRAGLGLVLMTVMGQLGWLVTRVPILDERFVLTLVPAILLTAALGFASLGKRARLLTAPLVILLGLTVCWDAHFGESDVFQIADPAWRLDHWRKLGMENAYNVDGAWARGETDGLDCSNLRDRLWGAVLSCEAITVGVGEREAPLLSEGYWWAFKSLDEVVRGVDDAEFRLLNTWDGPGAELVFTAGATPEGGGMVRIGDLDTSDCPEVSAIVVWAPNPREVCW